jgi:mannose-6-phosphate isomerase-like protein (cupin superfamily)
MPFEVFDYRTDLRNVLVTPQIRARFLKIDVGQVSGGPRHGSGHSHDLGHEVFLILQGRAEFEIAGDRRVVGPGQMCVALVDEVHTVANVGDDPVIMYLSVTPHIQPTHTMYTDDGRKAPPRFRPSSTYDVTPDTRTPVQSLVDAHADAASAWRAAVDAAFESQAPHLAALRSCLTSGDGEGAAAARDALWAALYPAFARMFEVAGTWNALTHRMEEV